MGNEHPLLLNGDMVRAVLDGSKTQTRRPIKPQPNPEHWTAPIACKEYHPIKIVRGEEVPGPLVFGFASEDEGWVCPFGKVGDTLWVRETALYWRRSDDNGTTDVAAFRADGYQLDDDEQWTPSIHMPRWASRLSLKITDVRVERVQSITDADCWAEGIPETRDLVPCLSLLDSPKLAFRELWDSIYSKQKPNKPDLSWNANPWVWAITFEVM